MKLSGKIYFKGLKVNYDFQTFKCDDSNSFYFQFFNKKGERRYLPDHFERIFINRKLLTISTFNVGDGLFESFALIDIIHKSEDIFIVKVIEGLWDAKITDFKIKQVQEETADLPF